MSRWKVDWHATRTPAKGLVNVKDATSLWRSYRSGASYSIGTYTYAHGYRRFCIRRTRPPYRDIRRYYLPFRRSGAAPHERRHKTYLLSRCSMASPLNSLDYLHPLPTPFLWRGRPAPGVPTHQRLVPVDARRLLPMPCEGTSCCINAVFAVLVRGTRWFYTFSYHVVVNILPHTPARTSPLVWVVAGAAYLPRAARITAPITRKPARNNALHSASCSLASTQTKDANVYG